MSQINMTRQDRLAKLRGTRQEALAGYTARERLMIEELEKIATGRTRGGGLGEDLEVARAIATEALQDVGWPTVDDVEFAKMANWK